jgi:lysophospholipase L1-like esterase
MVRILLAGDSLAYGLTAPLSAEAKKYGIELHGDGRTGTTAKQWITGGWLAKDIADTSPGMTLISLGTNDATGDLSHFAADVQTLVDQATSGGGVVGWIGPPAFASSVKAFPAGNVEKMRQILHDTLSARGIQIFPTEEHSYDRAPDGIHMTPAGYAKWAADVATWAHFPDAAPHPAAKSGGMSGGKIALLGIGGVALAVGLGWAIVGDKKRDWQ